MLVKAYIQEVLSPQSVRVRIPTYHMIGGVVGATPDELLPIAVFNTPPNVSIDPQVGDVVIVAFEEDRMSKPVIIGYLYSTKEIKSSINIKCENLNADGEIVLGDDIQIGDIKYENLKCLKGQKENIKDEIKVINSDIKELLGIVDNLNYKSSSNTQNIELYKVSNNAVLQTIQNSIKELEFSLNLLRATVENDYVKKYPTVVNVPTYGKDPITDIPNPEDGQLYFTLKE